MISRFKRGEKTCKLMLLTRGGKCAAPGQNAERGGDLARSGDNIQIRRRASTHSSGFNPPPHAPPNLILPRIETLFSLHHCTRWSRRGGGGGSGFDLPEQLPQRGDDPGSPEAPERHTMAGMGQHLHNNTCRARIAQLPHEWRSELPEEREDDKLRASPRRHSAPLDLPQTGEGSDIIRRQL